MQRLIYRNFGTLVLVALLGLLAACGNSTDSPSGTADSTSGHNEADVTFTTGMIPHHAQAIRMAQLAVTKASSQDVVHLARQIQDAQRPEIDTMTGWLRSWGQDTGMGSMPGMDHGDTGDSGMGQMMTEGELQQLADAAGPKFDRLWLQMMTKHHRGAIEMARAELRDGENEEVKALAQNIIDAQQAEILTMHDLLTRRPS